MGADVFCSSKSGASTAVFISPKIPNENFDSASEKILQNYKSLGEVEIISKKADMRNGILYGNLIFKQKDHAHHYTIIFADKIMLMVSSNASSALFETMKPDFESIVDSVKFF